MARPQKQSPAKQVSKAGQQAEPNPAASESPVDPAKPISADEKDYVLELYRTAFQRLQFQDEYLFRITGAFLTLHGALATLAGAAAFQSKPPNYAFFLIAGLLGVSLAVVWRLWIGHNDYWHAVWTGSLRDLEKGMPAAARLFLADHEDIANQVGRRKPKLAGHRVAMLMPWFVGTAWVAGVVITICLIAAG